MTEWIKEACWALFYLSLAIVYGADIFFIGIVFGFASGMQASLAVRAYIEKRFNV